MKKVTYIVGSFILAMLLTSCHYKLKEKDIQYIIPYQGNEILVFRSDQNRMDTIFFKGTRKSKGSVYPAELSLSSVDLFSLKYTKERNDKMEFEGKSFIMIVAATKNKTPEIWFERDILKDSWFHMGHLNAISLADFKKMPNTKLTVGNKTYNDVKVLEAGEKQNVFRSNVERIYWSVSEGFLGLDKRDEKWRLVEKYIPCSKW